jgi:hypothetical protein
MLNPEVRNLRDPYYVLLNLRINSLVKRTQAVYTI